MLKFGAAYPIVGQVHVCETRISAEQLRDLRQSPFVNLFSLRVTIEAIDGIVQSLGVGDQQ